MTQLTRFHIGQTSKVVAIVYLLLGLVFALCWLPFAMMAGSLGGSEFKGLGAGLGIGMVIVLPLLYAFIGWIGTAIACFIYNMVAGWVGGIGFDLEG